MRDGEGLRRYSYSIWDAGRAETWPYMSWATPWGRKKDWEGKPLAGLADVDGF
jgi:hypothetical protein